MGVGRGEKGEGGFCCSLPLICACFRFTFAGRTGEGQGFRAECRVAGYPTAKQTYVTEIGISATVNVLFV